MELTQSERAFHLLKSEILKGQIAEGVFLNVDSLLLQYDIGRTPFREACQRLHLEQLVDWVPRRGLMVRELTLRDVRDLLETRVIVEREIGALAAIRRSDDEIAALAAIGDEIQALKIVPQNLDQLIEFNMRFHDQLGVMSRNRELAAISRSLLERMMRISYLQLRQMIGDRLPTDLHGEIVRGIRDRNPHCTREAVLKDILHGQSSLFPAGHPIAAENGYFGQPAI
jgi:DNA-binding GntR family transcriptional regulator